MTTAHACEVARDKHSQWKMKSEIASLVCTHIFFIHPYFAKITLRLYLCVKVRRTLYLTIVKSQLSHATEIWSPSLKSLKAKIERVQRRATRWILRVKRGEVSYKDRLLKLNLLPLTYDRDKGFAVFLQSLTR